VERVMGELQRRGVMR